MRPTIKICGLTRAEDVRMCLRYGADILGFVTEYPRPVPWNLDARAAKGLIGEVCGRAKTCIVTGGVPDKILDIARETTPDYVQLHYNETPEEAALVAQELAGRGIKVIKALAPSAPDLIEAAREFEAAGIYALLLDPRETKNAARGGEIDLAAWQALRDAVCCPVILAGGLAPGNIVEALRRTGARIVDLMSGVESSPGYKDEDKVAALFRVFAE
ncbi:MAG TPA: N-(5'-phosphoribosyl)anthranilate isomerase [Clostridiales bacterium]|nr:N-(5'-phosphoribosyl)anthranilate isomerase [Clostridiales bacterium]